MDIKKVLQDEISRLARKEFKTLIASYEEKLKAQNKKIDELKKQLADLDRKKTDKPDPYKVPSEKELNAKAQEATIKPEQLKRLRQKFKLTQVQAAHLLDVSGQAYYSWEAGKSAPRFNSKVQILKLLEINKRTFKKLYQAKLDELDAK